MRIAKIKVLLTKILGLFSDFNTNNTAQTWVPVSYGTWPNITFQHRVIPRDIMTTRQKTVTIQRSGGASKEITADTVSGYTFVCWLQPATSGWVGAVYTQDPTASSTKIWNVVNQVQTGGNVVITALYKANF